MSTLAAHTQRDDRWRKAIDEAFVKREALRRVSTFQAFRAFNELSDGIEGLAIDVFDQWCVCHFVQGASSELVQSPVVLDAVAQHCRGVYVKHHPKQASLLSERELEEFAPREPVRGEPAPEPLVVRELSAKFSVSLGGALATGLYLDQRTNRAWVAQHSSQRRVLNLFAYSCSFSVMAALGGARSSVSVDTSSVALDRGAENFALNNLDRTQHLLVRDDATLYLRRAIVRNDRFDLIICDPPSFASQKGSTWEIDRHLGSLLVDAFRLLSSSGQLLLASNHRQSSERWLRQLIERSANTAGVSIRQVVSRQTQPDFIPPPGHEPNMKSLLVSCGGSPSQAKSMQPPARNVKANGPSTRPKRQQ